MKITASLIAHFSLRARSMTMSNEASCGPLLIASFIAAIRCEEDYRRYILVYMYIGGQLQLWLSESVQIARSLIEIANEMCAQICRKCSA